MCVTLKKAIDIERGDCVLLDNIRHIVTRAERTPKQLLLHFEGYRKTYNVTRGKYIVIDAPKTGYKFAFQLLPCDIVFIDDGESYPTAFTVKGKTRKGVEIMLEVYEMARRLTISADQQLELYNGKMVRGEPIRNWKQMTANGRY